MSKISIITVTRNRAFLLKTKALASLQQQTNLSFEWIVINDGADLETKELIEQVEASFNFNFTYREMPHPKIGFALCHGRNLGIELAQNELVVYLDDDNALYPNFTAQMTDFMKANPEIRFALPLQKRNRQVWHNGAVVSQGKDFISPKANSSIDDLICHRELFDSNGFTHYRIEAPLWNPNYRVYCDYEYFLQCLSSWICDRVANVQQRFAINPLPLVEYIQSNQGIIGQSDYESWANELRQILANYQDYQLLVNNPEYLQSLKSLKDKYLKKYCSGLNLPAFQGGKS